MNEVENTSCAATQPTQCMNKRNTAMWVLRLKETQKLTQTCVDSMLQDITELCTVTVLASYPGPFEKSEKRACMVSTVRACA